MFFEMWDLRYETWPMPQMGSADCLKQIILKSHISNLTSNIYF
jgi:hypothetical protein